MVCCTERIQADSIHFIQMIYRTMNLVELVSYLE